MSDWYERQSWDSATIDLSNFGGGLGVIALHDGRREHVNEYEKAFVRAGERMDDEAAAYFCRAYVKSGYPGMPGAGADQKVFLGWIQKMQNKPITRVIRGIDRFRSEQEPEAVESGKG